jgi:hypothetical protein
MDNIVDFTKFKVDKEIERFDELAEEIEVLDEFSADFAMSAVIDIAEALTEMGYDPRDNPECILDLFAMIEAIRGLVFRINHVDYPFNKISDSMFKEIFEEEGKDYGEVLLNLLNEIYN